MPPTLPYHYALSELLVAAAGLIGAWQLRPKNRLAAIALLPFGLAGLVGAIQITGNLGDPVITLHQTLSRAGSVFGLACMVGALGQQGISKTIAASLLLAVASAVWPSLVVPGSTFLLLIGAVLALGHTDHAYANAGGYLLLLPAQLVAAALRPAHPDIAWHLFHVLVSVWLLMAHGMFRLKGTPKPF